MNELPKFRIYKKGKKKFIDEFEAKDYNNAYEIFSVIITKYPDYQSGKYYFQIVHEYIDSDGKKYDDLHEFLVGGHEDKKYDKESRKYDQDKIKWYLKNTDATKIYVNLSKAVNPVLVKMEEFLRLCNEIKNLIDGTNLNTAPEEQMDEIIHKTMKCDDIRHDLENWESLITKKHQISEWWSIDYHMLEDLEYNLPILIKKSHTYPACFDETVKGTDKKPWDAWKDELRKLLLHVRLYNYYRDHGHVDSKNKVMLKIHKEYKDTLPYHKGSRDFDYVKLMELTKQHWDAIWDWMKEYGQALWD